MLSRHELLKKIYIVSLLSYNMTYLHLIDLGAPIAISFMMNR